MGVWSNVTYAKEGGEHQEGTSSAPSPPDTAPATPPPLSILHPGRVLSGRCATSSFELSGTFWFPANDEQKLNP